MVTVPDVGILAWGTHSQTSPFGRWSHSIAEIVYALRKSGLNAVAIPVQGLKENEKLTVWRPWKNDSHFSWSSEKTSPPDIFYNRILGRNLERQRKVQLTLRSIQENGKFLFNPGYLSKASVYEYLVHTDVARYLPETVVMPLTQTILELLEKWNAVYLKPLEACQGEGIFRVEKAANGWRVTGVRKSEPRNIHFMDKQSLQTWITDLLRKRNYLAQQGITLDKMQDRQYDMRVLVQKDGDGRWTYVGAGIRLAARGQVVTHRPNGGQVVTPKKVMIRRFGVHGWKRKEAELAQLAAQAAKVLEEGHGGNFGLITLDVACDAPEGNFWILEMNAKPGSFDEGRIQRKSYDLLAGYVRYLMARKENSHEDVHSI